MRDPSEASIHRFFTACPEALAHVCYLPLLGEDEPQLMMDMEAVRMFAAWAIVQGYTTMEHALEFLAVLRTFRCDDGLFPGPP